MTIEEISITLGKEYDPGLVQHLNEVLLKYNAIKQSRFSGVGGSQEIESIAYRIADDVVLVETETYVGLTISGEKSIVELLAAEVIARRVVAQSDRSLAT